MNDPANTVRFSVADDDAARRMSVAEVIKELRNLAAKGRGYAKQAPHKSDVRLGYEHEALAYDNAADIVAAALTKSSPARVQESSDPPSTSLFPPGSPAAPVPSVLRQLLDAIDSEATVQRRGEGHWCVCDNDGDALGSGETEDTAVAAAIRFMYRRERTSANRALGKLQRLADALNGILG